MLARLRPALAAVLAALGGLTLVLSRLAWQTMRQELPGVGTTVVGRSGAEVAAVVPGAALVVAAGGLVALLSRGLTARWAARGAAAAALLGVAWLVTPLSDSGVETRWPAWLALVALVLSLALGVVLAVVADRRPAAGSRTGAPGGAGGDASGPSSGELWAELSRGNDPT